MDCNLLINAGFFKVIISRSENFNVNFLYIYYEIFFNNNNKNNVSYTLFILCLYFLTNANQ